MTTYNTGNPIPSTDVRDLNDNVENLDNFTNGPLESYADRLGVFRQSLQGIRNASQYEVRGPYGAGLLFTSYNQVFSYLGEFYAPSAGLTLPYTTDGSGAPEIANFRPVGDAILRSDLLADGENRVSVNGSKLSGLYGEKVSIEAFGALPGGDATAAFAAAKLALAGTSTVLYLPNQTYTLSGTIYPGTLNIYSDGCTLLKEFKGVGMVFEGGQLSFDFDGTLFLDGSGIGKYDARLGIAPTATDEHGVHFNGNSFRIAGKIQSRYHAGDAFRYTVNGNMNRSDAAWLFGWDSVRNHYFEGIQDDFSVVEMHLHSYSSWQEGVRFSDDFSGRACTFYIYNELSSQDGISDGVYIGKLRTSTLDIYSEPDTTSGVSWIAKSPCEQLNIEDSRAGVRTVESDSVQVAIGGQTYPVGLTPTVVTKRYDQGAASQRTYTERMNGPGFVPLIDHHYRSDGQYTVSAYDVAASGQTTGGWLHSGYVQETYGGKANARFQAANGTLGAPTAFSVGQTFFGVDGHLKSAVGYSHGMQIRAELEVVGAGSNSTSRIVFAVSQGGATPVDIVKITPAGDVEMLLAGAGLVCRTTDGTKRYRIAVNNAGTITSTLL